MKEKDRIRIIDDIKNQYIQEPAENKLLQQQNILTESYGLVTNQKALLGEPVFTALSQVWSDAEAVMTAAELSLSEKQTLFYSLCNEYFRQLSVLSWKKRRAIKADKMIRRMKKCLSRPIVQNATLQYWLTFCKIAIPILALAFVTELWWIELRHQKSPIWQQTPVLGLCLLSFAGYFYACYHLEGRRLFGDLQSWIHYYQNPQGHSRPVGMFQVLRLLLPPLATIGGALIKIYYQQ